MLPQRIPTHNSFSMIALSRSKGIKALLLKILSIKQGCKTQIPQKIPPEGLILQEILH